MAFVKARGNNSRSLIELRKLATEILAHVYNTKDTLEEAVTTVLTRKSAKTFPEFERSWLFDVCSGVLRYRGRIDFLIDTYSLKKKPTGVLRRYLQTAVFQILAQDVEPALVVSETVQAISDFEGKAPSSFANAILRKVADAREDWRNWKITEASPFLEQLAWCSLPEWLFKRLRKERGSEWTFRFSEAVLTRPETWYRTNNESLLLKEGYQGNEPPGFVQDISNQRLVDEVLKILKTFKTTAPKILDLCSAPGGKSLALATASFSVTATDVSDVRLLKVIENRARLKLEEKIQIKPYSEIMNGNETYDLIWVDAPCSSTGIIRRHPEIKWNRTAEDVSRIRLEQAKLQEWASQHLTKEGVLIYSTCSVLKEEQEMLPALTLKPVLNFELVPQAEPFGDGISASIYTA